MIRFLIHVYIVLTIIDVIVGYVPSLVNRPWVKRLHAVTDWPQRFIRKYLPPDLPFDFSPLVVIFLLYLIMALW